MKYLAEHSKAQNILLHSAPGMEEFYARLGYRRLKTAIGLFAEAEKWRRRGYIE